MPVSPEQFGTGIQETTTTADPGAAGVTLALTAAVGQAFTGTVLRVLVQNSATDITNRELMLATAGYGTTSLTVTRGIEATTGVAHPVGSYVATVSTPESVRRFASNQAYIPRQENLVAAPYDPAAGTGTSFTPTAGRVEYMLCPVAEKITITGVIVPVTQAGTGVTALANCFVAVFTKPTSGTTSNQLGVSADQSTPWATTGKKTIALTGGPFTYDPAGDPAAWILTAILVGTQSTTPVQIRGGASFSATQNVNLVAGTDWLRYGIDSRTGATTIPASVTLAQDAASTSSYYLPAY